MLRIRVSLFMMMLGGICCRFIVLCSRLSMMMIFVNDVIMIVMKGVRVSRMMVMRVEVGVKVLRFIG